MHQQHEYSMFYLDALRNKKCTPRSAKKHREVHEREVYFLICLKKKKYKKYVVFVSNRLRVKR